jgi:hypothetical protein
VSDDNQKGPVDRALDVLVFAPLGFALSARDSVPGLVQAFAARGRAELDSRRHAAEARVEQARTVGRFAVDYGAPVVRRRVEERLNDARTRAEQGFTGLVVPRDERAPVVAEPIVPEPVVPERVVPAAPPAAPAPGPATAPASGPRVANGAGDETSVPTLSIPDYDELSASQVVQRLPGLTGDELEAIRAYETHGRGRRTILGKIDQLAR